MEKPRQIRSHAGLRGVAALLVMAYHLQFSHTHLAIEEATAFFRRGYLFVDLFFVLSGFIISYTNRADRRTGFSGVEYRAFMLRRLIRLYPLLLFTLVYLAVLGTALALIAQASGRTAGIQWTGEHTLILFCQLFMVNAWLPDPNAWNVPTWSISAELFAYLLFPLFVGLHAVRPRAALVMLMAIALVFYGTVAATTGSLDIIGGVAPFRCLAGFAIGMLIFYLRDAIAGMSVGLLTAAQLGAAAATLFLLAVPVNDVLLIPVFTVLVAATWTDVGPVSAALARAPFQFLGEISYSVYLNHVCVRTIIDLPVQGAIGRLPIDATAGRVLWIAIYVGSVVLISWLTFRHVEVPARNYLTRRLLGHRPRPIALSAPAP